MFSSAFGIARGVQDDTTPTHQTQTALHRSTAPPHDTNTSPRSSLTSVRNIVAAWKECTPGLGKAKSESSEGGSKLSPPAVPKYFPAAVRTSFSVRQAASDDESEPSDSFGEPTSRRQPNVKYRYNAKGKFRASPLKQTDSPSPSSKRQPKPKRTPKPKPVTPSHSQPSVHSKKRKAPASFSDREGTKLRRARGGSMRSLGAASSSFSQPLSQTSPRKRKADKTKLSDQGHGHSFGDVDTLVWVLVNDLGVIIASVPRDDDDIEFLEERMWWPARVVQKQPLRVTLFGDLALSREPSTISSPSESNIQPIHNLSGEKHFSRATFQVSSLTTSSNPSPSKKAKTDICERWEAAVKAMEDADELKQDEDIDDLRSTKKAKATPHAEFEIPIDRAWSPPPPDPMLQIPGELVLAQALRTRSNNRPAWQTGARASPTFSPANNPARLPPSANQGGFPPLGAQTNGSRTHDPAQERPLHILSGLTGTTITLTTKTAQRYEGVIASTAGEGDTTGVTLKDVKEISKPGAPLKESFYTAFTN
ncbi:hypothetical protein DFH29DRAFT_879012 [Suillus ampliporus]|nr:hypothetical protein DFH29DRAFT_879012 [Suillus ampliporus]